MISNPKHVVPTEDFEEEENIVDHNVDQLTIGLKKERRFKPCINLSTRRKKELLWEIKRLIAKISNPQNDMNECINQYIHVTEDVLNDLCNVKGRKAKCTNNGMFDVDSCGSPKDADESTIDEQLSLTLDKESSNTVHSKVQKTLKNKKK